MFSGLQGGKYQEHYCNFTLLFLSDWFYYILELSFILFFTAIKYLLKWIDVAIACYNGEKTKLYSKYYNNKQNDVPEVYCDLLNVLMFGCSLVHLTGIHIQKYGWSAWNTTPHWYSFEEITVTSSIENGTYF